MGKGKHQLQSLKTEAAHRIIQHFEQVRNVKKKKNQTVSIYKKPQPAGFIHSASK